MSIFEIKKDDLKSLSDPELEELIARLSEAELAAQGFSPAYVYWSGATNAPDGGVDVRIELPEGSIISGFIERPSTIFQAKKPSMPMNAIRKEMLIGDDLKPVIAEQIGSNGSYVIVSLEDDCSPPNLEQRIVAMRSAVEKHTEANNGHVGFYDRSKLLQWLRQHPSVLLWVKEKLGQGNTGWKPYGKWSKPPASDTDELILASGIAVTMPNNNGQKLAIEEAIKAMRDFVLNTNKAVRIIGLSGVGKTRIVQALFDETIGENALDKTIVVYADTSDSPNPSVGAMLDLLISRDKRAILVVDNCPPDLHASLASTLTNQSTEVRLITVEYDVKDDKPESTRVIHIEAIGLEITEKLLLRRFPSIGQLNAQRVAEFTEGNARMALAIAERIGDGENLAQLTDENLFNRLFEQRNPTDKELRKHAELLSLVYSFSMASGNELDVLGSLLDYSRKELFHSARELLARHVSQKRGDWQAILPQAIANRLAGAALDKIPVGIIRATFENPENPRLLLSFAHRLGMLHDQSVAKEVVGEWLSSGGLLHPLTILDGDYLKILDYVAPVRPELVLENIESEFVDLMAQGKGARRTAVIELLQLLAYEPHFFDRCIELLIRAASDEGESEKHGSAKKVVVQLSQAYLSGTHATLQQRVDALKTCFEQGLESLGFQMLSAALKSSSWMGMGLRDFGAHARDYGLYLNWDELAEWRKTFIEYVVHLGNSDNSHLENKARKILADNFRGLWRQEAIRVDLISAAKELQAHSPWLQGWKSVNVIINLDYADPESKVVPESLALLRDELEPKDLLSEIKAYVLDGVLQPWDCPDYVHHDEFSFEKVEQKLSVKIIQLGEDFAKSDGDPQILESGLFLGTNVTRLFDFGKGLAKGTTDLQGYWYQLVSLLDKAGCQFQNPYLFLGYINEVSAVSSELVQELLNQCAQHPLLRKYLVGLHPMAGFTEADFNRCMLPLDDSDVNLQMYMPFFYSDAYDVPKARVLELAELILSKPQGADLLIEALGSRLYSKSDEEIASDKELVLLGLNAITHALSAASESFTHARDFHVEKIVRAALSLNSGESEKLKWIDTIFTVIDESIYGFYQFDSAVKTTVELMPNEFLDYLFTGSKEQQEQRQEFAIFRNDSSESLLSRVSTTDLIDWCRSRVELDVWQVVALSTQLWSESSEENEIRLSEHAIALLDASPEPSVILHILVSRSSPSIWSGSRADEMQRRASAINTLRAHERPEIAGAVESLLKDIKKEIVQERASERQTSRAREQRFE